MLISNVHQIEVIFIMVDHRVYIYIYREELACCIILFCSFVIILINPVSFSNSRSKVQFIQLYMYTHTLIYTRISYGSERKRESCLFSIRWHKSQDDIWYTPPNLNSKYVSSVDLHMKIQKKKRRKITFHLGITTLVDHLSSLLFIENWTKTDNARERCDHQVEHRAWSTEFRNPVSRNRFALGEPRCDDVIRESGCVRDDSVTGIRTHRIRIVLPPLISSSFPTELGNFSLRRLRETYERFWLVPCHIIAHLGNVFLPMS